MSDLVKRLRTVVDDYDRDAADAAEQGEMWPHDPHTEVDLPVSIVRACADRIEALEAALRGAVEAIEWWEREHGCCRGATDEHLDAARAALSPTPENEHE